jgi:peptidoglycan/xylan/chitin deacetylase (PgdA/CDA1 family)
MADSAALNVVMYHYVRDLGRTAFPEIKGMHLEDFRNQVNRLAEKYEMATLESSLAFLRGAYCPDRDLCLLTFDDGFKEHFDSVTPILAQRGIQGVFFLVTSCIEDRRVAPVHMNHFLMARLGPEQYRALFAARLQHRAPEWMAALDAGHFAESGTYPWDTPEVARFKYFFNFVMDDVLRDELVSELFCEVLGSEDDFAQGLYVSWSEACAMQQAGMAIGGHTHTHRPLAMLSDTEQEEDLSRCRALLQSRLRRQPRWPFSYPYGKKNSFNKSAVRRLKQLRFDCAFSTEAGSNPPGSDPFELRRMDCKNAPA